MARAHFVKKARKADKHAGIKKGDSYYWWKFRHGGKHKSLTMPKPSQLTQSEFWGAVYSAQESAEDVPAFDDMTDTRDSIVSDLETVRDETSEKHDNVEMGFPNGSPVVDMLQERVDALEGVIDELSGIDLEPTIDEEEDAPEKETEAEKTARIDDLKEEKAQEVWQEVQDALGNISCE